MAPEIQHTLRSDCSTRTGSTSQDAEAEILISDAMIEKISAPAVLRTFFDEEFQIVPFLLRTSYFRDERRKPKNLFFVKKALVAFFPRPISAFFQIYRRLTRLQYLLSAFFCTARNTFFWQKIVNIFCTSI